MTLIDRMDSRQTEVMLRQLLVGARLISEIDLWGEPFERSRGVIFEAVRTGSQAAVGRRYPASTAVFLAGEGVRHYDGGFWERLSIPGADPGKLGPAFAEALERLGLDDYLWAVDNPTRRYVTPILFHGGIPKYCAADVFAVLHDELRRGAGDAMDVMAGWRANTGRFEKLDKPAQRFLLGGGDEAIDLLDRMIDLTIAGSEGRTVDHQALGLPRHLVDAYLELPEHGRRIHRDRRRVPRPSVQFDPWSGLGPELVLPALSDRADSERWTVLGGGAIQSYETSVHSRTTLELAPSGPWQLDLSASGSATRTFHFQGLVGVPALLFDPATGRLLRDQHRITLEEVDLVVHRDLEVVDTAGEALGVAGAFPDLVGAWSHHRTLRADVSRTAVIHIRPRPGVSGGSAEKIAVRSSGHRPRLVGDPVAGATATDGRPVYARTPAIHLAEPRGVNVEISVNGISRVCPFEDLPLSGRGFELEALVPDGQTSEVELAIRGHLGGDLRDAGFLVVPGLEFEAPVVPLGPEEATSMAVRAASDLTIDGEVGSLVVPVDPAVTSVLVAIGGSRGRALTVRLGVPRLEWSLSLAGRDGRLGAAALTLAPGDIDRSARLAVKTGLASWISLHLVGANGSLHGLGPFETGPEGRWSFDLGDLVDSIRAADRPQLELQVRIGGRAHRVGAVVTRYVVSDLEVEGLVDADSGDTLVFASFEENRSFSDRELRLWSRTRPWAEPIRLPIPDEAQHAVEILIGPSTVVPGEYLAEVDVADDWTVPSRPVVSPSTPAVRIGSLEAELAYQRALDPADGRAAVELLLRDARQAPPMADGLVATVCFELLMALELLLDLPSRAALEDRRLRAVRERLLQVPDDLARAVPDYLVASSARGGRVARTGISLVSDLFDCPFEELDDAERRRLHRALPLIAAAGDSWGSTEEAADRWSQFIGWCPGGDPPPKGMAITSTWLGKSRADLQSIQEALEIEDTRPLAPTGFLAATMEWLTEASADGQQRVLRWQSAHRRLNDHRARQGPGATAYLDALTAPPRTPAAANFSADVLAAAFHLIRWGGIRDLAAVALWDAHEFAPLLVERSILLAIALNRS